MGPIDTLLHLMEFLLPALGVAALAASGARLFWRRELQGVRWRDLVGSAASLGVLALGIGWVVLGRDGRIGSYALLVVGCALGLWWRGWGPGQRR